MDDPTREPDGEQAREFRQIQRVTLAELLEELQQLHERLSAFYHDTAKKAADQRAAMLLHYLERHEQYVRDSIGDYEAEADDTTLQSWFRYARTIPIPQLVERARLDADSTADDVTRVAAEISDYVIGALESIAAETPVPEVEEALNNLRDVEERAKIEALRGADEGMT